MTKPTNSDIETIIQAFTKKERPKKAIPTVRGHPNKKNEGVFKPYYGIKFFCTHTGAVFELKERDPGLGLNVLRMHRNSYRRLILIDKERVERGLEPNYLGDLYLSDAETVLLLKEYPLPYLGLELKLLSKENIRKAMESHDKACEHLLEEVEARRKHRKALYRLDWKNHGIKEKVKPIRVEGALSTTEAKNTIHRDSFNFEDALIEEGIMEKPVKLVRPKHKTKGRPKRRKS